MRQCFWCFTGIILAVVLPVLAVVLLSVAAWYYRSYLCLRIQAAKGTRSVESSHEVQISPYPATYPTCSDANAQDQHAIWCVMSCCTMPPLFDLKLVDVILTMILKSKTGCMQSYLSFCHSHPQLSKKDVHLVKHANMYQRHGNQQLQWEKPTRGVCTLEYHVDFVQRFNCICLLTWIYRLFLENIWWLIVTQEGRQPSSLQKTAFN